MKRTLQCVIVLSLVTATVTAQIPRLWTSTTVGGVNGSGTILEGDTDGSNFHVVHSFDNANGSYPQGRLSIAPNGKLYGHTRRGGVGDSCVIFSLDTSSHAYSVLYDDENYPQAGVIPYAGFTLFTDGKYYGLASQGGAHNAGVVYSFDPNTNTYTDVYDFIDSLGSLPESELLLAPDGKFYGTTDGGGKNGTGVIFSYDPLTSHYAVLYHNATNGNPSTNYYLSWSRLVLAGNGKFYSTVQQFGFSNGYLFSFSPGDTAITNLHQLSYRTDGRPVGGLFLASDGKLYGMTSVQSSVFGNYGEIYSYDIALDSFTVLKHFDSTTGYGPERTFIQLPNGKLIGTTMLGGTHHFGVIFTFDIRTNTYTTVLNLDSATTGANSSAEVMISNEQLATAVPLINSREQIKIYPNPGENLLKVENVEPETGVTIVNALGVIVMKKAGGSSNIEIDISQLPPGLYFVNNRKFVKQ